MPGPLLLWYGMFGKRDWELIDKEVLPSPVEQLLGAVRLSDTADSPTAPKIMFQKTVVLTFKCSITGKIQVITKTLFK